MTEVQTNDLRSTIEFLLDNMELVARQVELNAVLMRKGKDALIRAGFTEDQALEIIKARGAML
ncbi:hypothetical protein P5637_23115 [Bacillus paralicheniformis]|uniref:Uncharacterized protein n=2 Tax=Bacillus subtilis group TaxID=653685 RepID=A0ABY3FYI4_9BACI|nr:MULTISPECIES: hypothetical protein [Bacillus subtilis group]KYC76828.1 hypothetical protein B4090_3514 [Bacillus licheniformis]MDE1437657.1 hypothetical protein [Bacillus licheniformis]MEC1243890.1 hypothetical protein [Bacillus licheniformis]MEC1326475.1 hypothetical protein [Bacillus licheniformis]OJT65472.1 hypothetical protein BFP49_09505 [Bacillus licheniformis]